MNANIPPQVANATPEEPNRPTVSIPELINISSILIAKKMMAEEWAAVESLTISQQRMCQSLSMLGVSETINQKIKEIVDAVSASVVTSLFSNK